MFAPFARLNLYFVRFFCFLGLVSPQKSGKESDKFELRKYQNRTV